MKTSRLAKTGGIALASSMLLMGALPVASAMAASKPAVMLTGPSDVNQTAGSNVTYTASASNVSNPNYQFWVEEPNGHWMMAQNWSSSNTFTLKNVQDGDYLVTAYVAPKGDWKAATNEQANGQQAVDGVFVDTSITVSAPSTLTAGQPVTVTASSANIYDAQYQFWYKTPSGVWMQSGNYGSSSYTFTPTETGSYEFVAYAKSPLALNDPEGAAMSTNTATTAVGENVPSLTALHFQGETAGTGTASSPATSLNGSPITVSTSLQDANGNPVADTQITYNITLNGSSAPTVMSGSSVLSPSSVSGVDSYTVYTDSSGAATISVTGPSGQTAYYNVSASAPYQNVTTTTADMEFVADGQAGIAPYGTAGTPSVGSLGTATPVTITLPPSGATPQADEPVTLTVDGDAYFTNPSGSNLGQSVTVYSNSVGQAITWVNDATAGQVAEVQASVTGQSYSIPSTYLEWQQAGIASQIANLAVSNSNPVAGQDVTISGTVEDAAGNPVPNAQLLLTSSGGNGSYLTGSTPHAFSNVSIAEGVPATSTYGDVLSTDSAGNFSVTVTDSAVETDTFSLWNVNNGTVSSSTALGSELVTFATPTAMTSIVTAANSSALADALTNQTTAISGINSAAGTTATAYFEPSNAADTAAGDQSLTYQLSVNNGGSINAINGISLPNAVSAETLTVNYDASNADPYSFSVPGDANFASSTTPWFSVGVTNAATGNTVLTVASGSAKATATEVFGAGPASQLANVSPVSGSIQPGGTQTLSFEVEDANGNPVEGTEIPVTITPGTSAPSSDGGFWITEVNGIPVQQSEPTGSVSTLATQATPIPLFDTGSLTSAVGYATSGVSVPGVVSWNGSTTMDVMTQATGEVTLTLAAGGNTYYSSDTMVAATAPLAPASYSEMLGSVSPLSLQLWNSGVIAPTDSTTDATISTAPSAATVSAANSSLSLSPTTGDTMETKITITGTVANDYGTGLSDQSVTIDGLQTSANGTGTSVSASTTSTGSFTATGYATTTGTDAVSATAGGVSFGSQNLTINAGPIAGVEVSSVSVPLGSPETVTPDAYTSGAASQTVTSLAVNSTYTFTVTAVDAQGNPTLSGASGAVATLDFAVVTDASSTSSSVTIGTNGEATFSVTTNSTTAPSGTFTITYDGNVDTVTLK